MTYTAAQLRRGMEAAELYELGQRGAYRELTACLQDRIRELEPMTGTASVVTELKIIIEWMERR